jgi:uncharacterized protein involved in outer membrane biogenesis
MALIRTLQWTGGILLAPIVLATAFIALFGWNWLRGPLERMAVETTGRVLALRGDLTVTLAWPRPHLHANAVTFANPPWARQAQMFTADAVDITVDLPQLLRRKLVFPEVRLARPVVFLEQGADGRKSWLLDRQQQDESARILIDRLKLDEGTLGYDDAAHHTSIRSALATRSPAPGDASAPGVSFNAQGQYQGLALVARGSGGPVLAIRDEGTPYPMKIDATIGRTGVRAEGTVTSLLQFSAVDVQLALKGDSLAQLFPLLGLAFPATPRYATEGRLMHQGSTWRYEKFAGRIGSSDIAGSLLVETGGPRPALTGELVSQVLDIQDLGPVIGARPGRAVQARVLPDLPFSTDRWRSVDAQVSLRAKTLRRPKELPLQDLQVHLGLRDAVLTLEPLRFGVAGGQLNTTITLDGRADPIHAHALVQVQKIRLAQLFPTIDLTHTSIGQVNGEFDLTGSGNSVGRMLATSHGKVGLVVMGGEISKLLMEKIGLHLWEILALKLTGDRRIKVRCGVVDFDVYQGVMKTDALIFDTEVTTIIGTGIIDLGRERLDLTFNPKTKNTSPLALRSPIYLRGSFAQPVAQVDALRVATRALGAVALGLVNPLLTVIPLIDAGPGQDRDCRSLVKAARALPRSHSKSKVARP